MAMGCIRQRQLSANFNHTIMRHIPFLAARRLPDFTSLMFMTVLSCACISNCSGTRRQFMLLHAWDASLCTLACTLTHAHSHSHISTLTHAHNHMCTLTQSHAHSHTCIHTHTHLGYAYLLFFGTHTHAHALTQTHIYTCTHMYTYTHTCTHTHTHTHTLSIWSAEETDSRFTNLR